MYKRKLCGYGLGGAPQVHSRELFVCTRTYTQFCVLKQREPRPTQIMPRTAADPLDSVFVPHLGGNGRRLELRPGLSQIYVKDGQHRESLVRVAKAADQRVADLCRMVPGLCEDDLTGKFIALLTGKVTVPSDEPLPEPSNVAEPRELKELGPTVNVGSRVVHSTDVFMHSKDSVRDDYKSRHLGHWRRVLR